MTKEEYDEHIRLLDYRLEHEKYRFYEPNGVAETFIHAVGSNDYLICFISAANGVGKTALEANIVANLAFPGNNPWFHGGVWDKWPYRKNGRIVTESALVEKNIVNELKFWLPEGHYTASKAGKHYESSWKTDTGFSWDIMTYDQDPKQFEGVTLGWAVFDEPPPDAILKATIARMRKGGIIVIGATPISGSAHLYDMFATGEIETTIQLREDDEPQKVMRRVFHITADVESACKEHGIRGHLEHEHIVQMVAEYPPDERQARVFGKFQHLIGLVFKRWNRDIHVIEPFAMRPEDYVVYHALDPHPRNEDAGLWVAVDRNGTKFVVDEYYENPEDVSQLAFYLKKKSSQYRMSSSLPQIDPSATVEDQHTKKALKSLLEDEGLYYIEGSKQRAAADKRIEKALNYTDTNGLIVRPPELYVFKNCTRLIKELEHYRWSEWKGKAAEERDRKEKPVDKDDHEIECLGRILFAEPTFEPMRVPKSYGGMEESEFDPYAS